VVVEGGWVRASTSATPARWSRWPTARHPAQHPRPPAGLRPRGIERFNDRAAGRAGRLGRVEEVTGHRRAGRPVQMWLCLPARLRPEEEAPGAAVIHGGPHTAAGDSWHYRWNTQVFASQGYVVACVNYHGSTGFGYAFKDSITHRWGELELQDVEAGTDWLLQQPWADRKRSSPPAAATAASWWRG
jgi:dipeptidyl aminopeptidase/acylaminoacyl peptidase